jgi:hypothetical protein
VYGFSRLRKKNNMRDTTILTVEDQLIDAALLLCGLNQDRTGGNVLLGHDGINALEILPAGKLQ